jgi:hypothetical protein
VILLSHFTTPHDSVRFRLVSSDGRCVHLVFSDRLLPRLLVSVSKPGGFPDHPHRGFETVTYMLEVRTRALCFVFCSALPTFRSVLHRVHIACEVFAEMLRVL